VAIIQALLAFVSRSLGRITSAIFGWAVVVLFGSPHPELALQTFDPRAESPLRYPVASSTSPETSVSSRSRMTNGRSCIGKRRSWPVHWAVRISF